MHIHKCQGENKSILFLKREMEGLLLKSQEAVITKCSICLNALVHQKWLGSSTSSLKGKKAASDLNMLPVTK